MDGNEVKARIAVLNEIIQKELKPGFFTLNKKVQEARQEIEILKLACDHVYDENDCCIYCGKERYEWK